MDIQDGERDEGSDSGGAGGAARSALRAMMRRFGSATIGSFPQPNPKLLAKQADKISELMDHALHVSTESQLLKQKLEASEKPHRGGLRKWITPVFYAIPSIVKSSVLGAFLFSSYGLVTERAESSLSEHSINSNSDSDSDNGKKRRLIPALAGAASGAVHGAASVAWDKALLLGFPNLVVRWDRVERLKNSSLRGTILAHSLVHSSLFGCYHLFKQSLPATANETTTINNNSQHSSAMAMANVVFAGCVAGGVAELVGYYTAPLEQGRGWGIVKLLPRPAVRSILLAAVPSGIGFFAFEYA